MRRDLRVSAAFAATVIAISASHSALARPRPPIPVPAPSTQGAAAQNNSAQAATAQPSAKTVTASIALADIGFKNGFRMANLGARRVIFVPLPQNADVKLTDLILKYDDLSAFKAKRNFEVLVNDRTVATVPLEGNGSDRSLRVPLAGVVERDGFIKLTFLYSGAATPDRCIDVRYVGDSLTIRPETAVNVAFDPVALQDVTTIAALMPRDVTVLVPERALSASEIAAALTVARALNATGHHPEFSNGAPPTAETVDTDGRRYWTRGTIVIGAPYTGAIPGDSNNPLPGTLSTIRIGGMPALLLTDVSTSMRAARLLGTPSLAAARGMAKVAVAEVSKTEMSTERVTFNQLGVRPASVDVYGRAELDAAVDMRELPANTRISRLALNVLVAPDGAGDKAVVSLFVNGTFLSSAVAETAGPTHLEQSLPDGLAGTVANISVVVQRRSAAGDCRFEPQGYPAQILGSSAVVLSQAGTPHDFADLATRWTNGIEVMVPQSTSDHPLHALSLLSETLSALSGQVAPISVRFAKAGAAPSAPFLAVSDAPPQGATPRVRFDRGQVAVKDRSGRTLLDLAGFNKGSVAQLVEANGHPGIWVKGFSSDSQLPTPAVLKLDHGDVAFIDQTGVAFAMSTVRDTLVMIAYPEQTSWTTVSERFRSWIIGGFWILATIAFLFALQSMLRRRAHKTEE
jgi:hypothetical protein